MAVTVSGQEVLKLIIDNRNRQHELACAEHPEMDPMVEEAQEQAHDFLESHMKRELREQRRKSRILQCSSSLCLKDLQIRRQAES